MTPLFAAPSLADPLQARQKSQYDRPDLGIATAFTSTREATEMADPEIMVLTMTASGTGLYYTLPINVGGSNFAVQIDTGSSDLWLASATCPFQACKGVPLYNPLKGGSSAVDTNSAFNINYVIGAVEGKIYYDTVKVGSRTIPRQVSGNSVIAERLPGPNNLGLLSNLKILPSDVPAVGALLSVTGRSREFLPDGATFPDPTTPTTGIPFLSLALGRPSDPRITSQLGLRAHLPTLCDTVCSSNLKYTKVVESPTQEPLFWRTTVQSIDVMDKMTGQNMKLSVGRSMIPGQALPVGLLDSGAQGIYIANRELVNAIYGSQGVGPAVDGMYYLDCNIAIQMAVTIGNVRVPVHPLDISDYMSSDSTHKQCLGAIQWINPDSVYDKGDIILGVAFMRNAYTVLCGPTHTSLRTWTTPSMALVALTDTATSAIEFNLVRILKQPIVPLSSSTNSSTPTVSGVAVIPGKTTSVVAESTRSFGAAATAGVSVAAVVLFAVGIFLSRYLVLKRRSKRNGDTGGDSHEQYMGGADFMAAQRVTSHPLGTGSRNCAQVPPVSPGSSLSPSSTHSEENKTRKIASDGQRVRCGSGTVGSSTLRLEEDEKATWVAIPQLAENAVEPDFEVLPSPGQSESLADFDGFPTMPAPGKTWRIQDERASIPPDPSTRPGPSPRNPSGSNLSASDLLLLSRREARRKQLESPAINRLSSSTISSAILHLRTLPLPTR